MKTIAVVGISQNPIRPSHFVSKYLMNNGFKIFPINPGKKEILGIRCYPTLKDLPHKVDIVNVFRNANYAVTIIEEAIFIKAKAVWLQDGIVSEEAKINAKKNKILFVMDDCMLRQHRYQNA